MNTIVYCSNKELIQMICKMDEIQELKITIESCLKYYEPHRVKNFLKHDWDVKTWKNLRKIFIDTNTNKYRVANDILLNDLRVDEELELAILIRSFLSFEDVTTVEEFNDQLKKDSFSENIKSVITCFLNAHDYDIKSTDEECNE